LKLDANYRATQQTYLWLCFSHTKERVDQKALTKTYVQKAVMFQW